MKKTNLVAAFIALFFLTSCREDSAILPADNNQDYTSQHSVSNKNSINGESSGSLAIVEGDMLCGGGSGNWLTLDPNQTLITDFNVSFYDGSGYTDCLNNGRECIDLSHFVGIHLPVPVGRTTGAHLPSNKYYYGSSREYAFDSSVSSGQMVAIYTIGETGNDGSAFGGYPYIIDENTNKVLQAFKSNVAALQASGYQIRAYHLKTDALLCVPAYKFIQLKIKYSL